MSGHPRYVERGGDMVVRHPIACNRTRMFSWMLDADWDALVALCDRAFKEPSGGRVVVRPILPMVACVSAEIRHGCSADALDGNKGWARERDLGFWIPVARGRLQDDGDFEIEQIGWYLPYLFIDSAAAVLLGRETYGFAKSLATCDMPANAMEPSRFRVETQILSTFTRATEARVEELYKLERTDGGPLGALVTSVDSFRDMVVEASGKLVRHFVGRSHLPVPTWQLARNLYNALAEGLVPMFFLRQFRDVAAPERACYQAIIEASCDITAWHGGGFVDEHVLTIRDCASHPLRRDLGLPHGAIETGFGFWAEFDFVVGLGKELWRA
jgi:hypothetical protein